MLIEKTAIGLCSVGRICWSTEADQENREKSTRTFKINTLQALLAEAVVEDELMTAQLYIELSLLFSGGGREY